MSIKHLVTVVALATAVLYVSVTAQDTPAVQTVVSKANLVKETGIVISGAQLVEPPKQPLCDLCVQEVLIIINVVLNDILNGVILNSCGKLCGLLPNATKKVCTLACDIFGIKKLVQYLNSTDPDEIYVCSKIGLCKAGNCTGHGDGSTCLAIDSMTAPSPVKINDALNIVANLDVKQELIAAGMSRMVLNFPNHGTKAGQSTQTDNLNLGFPAGNLPLTLQIPEGTLNFEGNYSVSLEICESSCGSTHPHSSVYDKKVVDFQVTKNGPGPTPPAPPAPPAPPGSTHYGDPAKGPCEADEEKVQITGVKGDFCSPKCTGATCPTDLPSGTTAQPKCVLETSGSKTPTQCALLCKGAGAPGCPEGASCKAIQGLGLCTYDD